MITINLLPHELRPIKHTPIPYLLSGLVLLLALGIMGFMFVANFSAIQRTVQDLDAKKSEFSAMEPEINRYNELSERKLVLERKASIIKEILSDRVIWSEHLHQLAALTPDNIWYKRIRVVWQSFKEQQVKLDPKTNKPVLDPKTNKPMLDPRTQQPQMETKVIQKPVLEISGYVVSDEQGERQVSPLLERTTKPDSPFSKVFTLQPPKIEDTEFKGFAVRGFTLNYVIEGGGKT